MALTEDQLTNSGITYYHRIVEAWVGMAFPFLWSFISPCEKRGLVISWRLLKECNGRGVGWGEVRRRVIGYDSSTGLVIFEAGDLDEVEVREQIRGRDRTRPDRA